MVFISYKSEEYDIARRLRLMLEDHYYSCWMAPESIPGGSNYMHEIPKAIRKCDLFLLIVSETSQQSQWVQKEIDRAVKFNKQIIPFHVDDSELIDAIDFVISNAQRIEAYHNFDEACEELLEAVRRAHPPVKGPDGQTAAQAPKTEKKPTEDASAPAGVNPALLAALAAGNSNLPPDVLMQLLDKLPPEYVAQMIPGYNAQNAAKPAEPAPIPEPELIMDVQTWDEDPFAFLDGDQGISAQTWDEDPFAITEIEELPPEPAPEPKPEPVAPAEQPKPAPEIPAEPAPAPAPIAPRPQVQPQPTTPTLLSSSTNSTLQRRAQQAIITEIKSVYESNYVQNNPNGFKVKVGELVDYKPHRKEEGVVVIPYGIKTIGDSVFAKKKSVRCVVVPPTVEEIGPNAFFECENLEKVIFHEGLVKIGNGAFHNCHLLNKITLPKSLREIGAFAFFGCPNARVPLHRDIIKIGAAAFNGCEYVSVHAQNPVYYMHSKCIINKETNTIVTSAADCQFPNNLNITVVGDYAFEGSCAIWSVAIPDYVTRIGTRAFFGCLNLKEVVVESGVEMIGKQAFAECSALESVEIKPGVQMIEAQAFSHCRNLRRATVPQSVRYVARDAFEGCGNLRK